MSTLQIIGLCVSIVTGSFTFLTLISSKFRGWLLNAKKDKQQREEEESNRRETDKCLLRDRITSIYFSHCTKKEIEQYEYENVERLYAQYKKLGGNSFVDKIWKEMQDWTITR